LRRTADPTLKPRKAPQVAGAALGTHGTATAGSSAHAGDPAPRVDTVDPPSTGNRLVELWQAGGDQEEIFRRIFETYYRQVYSFFAKRGFPVQECQDLAQETFLKVHKGLSTFRCEARFETWLFQITANLYRNTLRSQATLKREAQEVSLEEIDEPDPGSGPAGDPGDTPLAGVLIGEEAQVLRHALDSLPPQMRHCVLLRIDQDLRYREIAELMRVSIDTVKAHLYQARQQLKGKLAGYYADPDF
jgi:RNA polymerase sigma-70 factor, ECF subfamily